MAIQPPQQISIDPRFLVPPGVVDLRQQDASDSSQYYTPADVAATPAAVITPGQTVSMPTSFTVYEQRVRISPSGTAVVDVTLDFPDISGVASVDVRVTKI